MIMQGLALTAIGMGTVFLFLLVLIAMMSNLERVTAAVSKLIPAGEERDADASRKMDMAEIAAAVFIATRQIKRA